MKNYVEVHVEFNFSQQQKKDSLSGKVIFFCLIFPRGQKIMEEVFHFCHSVVSKCETILFSDIFDDIIGSRKWTGMSLMEKNFFSTILVMTFGHD